MSQETRVSHPIYNLLPTEIEGFNSLAELALDMCWSWNHATDEVWRKLDPVLWELVNNPWVVLQTVSRDQIERVLADPVFRKKVDRFAKARRQAIDAPAWFQENHAQDSLTCAAYFSMEFMLSEALPIYSGGLGNVAGDQLKAASDLGVPVVGVGLLYQQGYFRQAIDTPRRPWEASRTSGMKVLVNGGINLSELDGWWAEAYTPEVGWALGDGQEHGDDPAWDAFEADALYDLLEREVIPEFYARDESGIPTAWIQRMRESMARLTPIFCANRTVREYTEQHYLPAAAAYGKRAANQGAAGREVINWEQTLKQKWATLHFGEVNVETRGQQHLFEVQVYLDNLDPRAVRVELYADGINSGASGDAVRSPTGGCIGRLPLQHCRVCRPRTHGLYGASDPALRRRLGATGRGTNPMAAMI